MYSCACDPRELRPLRSDAAHSVTHIDLRNALNFEFVFDESRGAWQILSLESISNDEPKRETA